MSRAASIDDEILRLLEAHRAGDADAHDALFSLLYEELRELAAAHMRSERADHTLVPTSLVHDVYVKLEGARFDARDRREFLGLAATAMRRTLIDSARRRQGRRAASEDAAGRDGEDLQQGRDLYLLALDEALDKLRRVDPEWLQVVELRFLVGLEIEATAEVLGVSAPTVKRRWRAARAWLQRELDQNVEGT